MASDSERGEPADIDIGDLSFTTSGECTVIVQYYSSDISVEITDAAVASDESLREVVSVELLVVVTEESLETAEDEP